jgi:hypothetical protein
MKKIFGKIQVKNFLTVLFKFLTHNNSAKNEDNLEFEAVVNS